MTPKQEAALRLALEALQYVYEGANNQGPHTGISWRCASNKVEPVIAAIDEALAEQPAQPDMNLNCKSVQARLATSWGYVKAEQPAQQQTDERIDALRTLDYCHGLKAGWNFCAADDDAGFERAMAGTSEAVRILKTQPAQQQEPVAVVSGYYGGQCVVLPTNPARVFNNGTAFYTSPPASKPWVGLTQQDIDIAFDDTQEGGGFDDFARAIEAKLKEKNNGTR